MSKVQTINSPPAGLYFRLVNKQSGQAIFSNSDGRFGDWRPGNEVDQFWRIESAGGLYFRIVNKQSGRVIYSNSDGRFDAWYPGPSDDQLWKLDSPGTEWFRLLNKQSGRVIYSNSDGRFGAWYPGPYDDQYFHFEYEDYDIISVSYNYDKGIIRNKVPEVIATMLNNNSFDAGADNKITFYVDETIEHHTTFNYELGFQVTIGAKFEAGVPFVADGEVSTEVTNSHKLTWGSEDVTSESYKAAFEVVAKPGEIIRAEATVWSAQLEVPYDMTLKCKDRDYYFHSYGTWKGVTTWDIRCVFKKINKKLLNKQLMSKL